MLRDYYYVGRVEQLVERENPTKEEIVETLEHVIYDKGYGSSSRCDRVSAVYEVAMLLAIAYHEKKTHEVAMKCLRMLFDLIDSFGFGTFFAEKVLPLKVQRDFYIKLKEEGNSRKAGMFATSYTDHPGVSVSQTRRDYPDLR